MDEDQVPRKLRLGPIGLLLCIAAFIVAFAAAVTGCATRDLRGEVVVLDPTALVAGPVKGHLVEENSQGVAVWTVLGNDCRDRSRVLTAVSTAIVQTFEAPANATVCAMALPEARRETRVLWHAETP